MGSGRKPGWLDGNETWEVGWKVRNDSKELCQKVKLMIKPIMMALTMRMGRYFENDIETFDEIDDFNLHYKIVQAL